MATVKSKKKILKTQNRLLKELVKTKPFVIGSLYTVKRICGNNNCQCRKNPEKKHPAMFLTWKEKKKTKTIYILSENQKETLQWSENYKKMKLLLNQISDNQKELLRLR